MAYRNMLVGLRNRAELDDLHDFQGKSLVRVAFTATILPPPPDYLDTLGVVHMRVVPPTEEDLNLTYRRWLDHANTRLNGLEPESNDEVRFVPDARLARLEGFGLFRLEEVSISNTGSDPCDGGQETECRTVHVALPADLPDTGETLEAMLKSAPSRLANAFSARTRELADGNFLRKPGECAVESPEGKSGEEAAVINAHITQAAVLVSALEASLLVERSIEAAPWPNDESRNAALKSYRAYLERIQGPRNAAERLLTAAAVEHEPCDTLRSIALRAPSAPQRFENLFEETMAANGATTYAVYPRERAQRLSTTARGADALALAATFAARVPQLGLGGSTELGFARNAIGKAEAQERAPLVVSFANARAVVGEDNAEGGFGWLLGPPAALNPDDQSVALRHRPAVQDLAADLSVPSWWPYFEIEIATAWGPNWRNAAGTALDLEAAKTRKTVRIDMAQTSANMDALTDTLMREVAVAPRTPSVRSVTPETIRGCATDLELVAVGPRLWRAREARLAGVKSKAVAILPDMSGAALTFAIPPETRAQMKQGEEYRLSVFTPDGQAFFPVKATDSPRDCS
jgi:hypothetical protein